MNQHTGGGAGTARASLLLAACLGAAALPASAQNAAAAGATPDIFGMWIGIGDGRPDIDPPFRKTANSPTPELTKWGSEESRRLGRLGTETGTAGACEPVHPVMFLSGSRLFPVQILQGPNQIVMLNEWQPL